MKGTHPTHPTEPVLAAGAGPRDDLGMTSHSLGFGFRVGHWSDHDAHTGCTVILPPTPNVASCDIRGSSPGSRELALLDPDRKINEIHAVLLTGGSAFGLAAADGVMRWLEERGIGYSTGAGVVPLVPAAVVFDLSGGDPAARPGPAAGYAACEAATEDDVGTGRVGVGTGTSVGKWAGLEHRVPGWLGFGHAEMEGLAVSAVAVVNSVGDVVDENGRVVAGTTSPEPRPRFRPPAAPPSPLPGNTVLAVVAVPALLDKRDVRFLAARGSDGITSSVRPAHTRYDGDVVFAIAAPPAGAAAPDARSLDILGYLATQAVARAVRAAPQD